MNRIREVRRGTAEATTNGGLSRRRPRSGGLRYSPEDDGAMDAQEMEKFRDRGARRDRDRDRSGRNMTRRGNRMLHGSNRDEEENNSEESLEDDDDVENDDMLPLVNLPPSQLAASPLRPFFAPPNSHYRGRPAKDAVASPGWKVADKMIGVPVPRKARSAPGKRPQDCGVSSISPARQGSASPSPISPSSSGASAKKKTRPIGGNKHTRPPKIAKSSIQELEIEVAEVLFGMTKQLQSQEPPKVESKDAVEHVGDVKMAVSTPNSTVSTVQAAAPKRKKPRTLKLEDKISVAPPASTVEENTIASNGGALLAAGDAKLDLEPTFEAKYSKAVIGEEAGVQLDTSSEKNGDPRRDPAADGSPKEKCSLDLMSPPAGKLSPNGELYTDVLPADTGEGCLVVDVASSERDSVRNLLSVGKFVAGDERKSVRARTELIGDECDTVANDSEKNDEQDGAAKLESKPEKLAPTVSTLFPCPPLSCWPGSIPFRPLGYMGHVAPLQSLLPINGTMDAPKISTQTQSLLPLAPHPRLKRCTTHCYIAKNIFYHQQMARMNPFWPTFTGVMPPVYGVGPYILDATSHPESSLHGNPPSKEKAAPPPVSGCGALVKAPNDKQVVLQQLSRPGALKDMKVAAAAAAAVTVGRSTAPKPVNGVGNGASSSSSASNLGLVSSFMPGVIAAMNINYTTPNEVQAQYLAMLKNSGYSLPTAPSLPVGGSPIYMGASMSQTDIPYFNGALCYPQMLSSTHQSSSPSQHAQQAPHTSSVLPSPSQKHPHQSGINVPSAAARNSSSNANAASKQQRPRLLPHLVQQPELTEMASGGFEERLPSSAEAWISPIQKSNMHGQDFSLPILPQNFAFVSSTSAVGGVGNHTDKASQPFALSFASPCNAATIAGGALPPGLDLSAMAQSHQAFLQSLPEAARHAYQMNTQHFNGKATPQHIVEDRRSVASNCGGGGMDREEVDRKLSVPSSNAVTAKITSSGDPNPLHHHHQLQVVQPTKQPQQQQQLMSRSKPSTVATTGPYSDQLPANSASAMFPTALAGFTPHQGVNSHLQWKNTPAPRAPMTTSPSSSTKTQNPPHQHSLLSSTQVQQISFGANSPAVLNSSSNSTSKGTTITNSAPSTPYTPQTQAKNSSIPGHQHVPLASTFSGSKQPQQATFPQQHYFNNASYMHSQASQQQQQLNASAAAASYFQRRLSEKHHQQQLQPGAPSSTAQVIPDSKKTASTNCVKGTPPGMVAATTTAAALPYVQAMPPVSVKAAEQKPAAA